MSKRYTKKSDYRCFVSTQRGMALYLYSFFLENECQSPAPVSLGPTSRYWTRESSFIARPAHRGPANLELSPLDSQTLDQQDLKSKSFGQQVLDE